MSPMSKAFTLIELLVVVTIIVVLLALLTPALDKAIYQAELAVCGARMDAIHMSVTSYAMGFNRRYPYRTTMGLNVLGGANNGQMRQLSEGGSTAYDDRPILRGHLPLAMLQCPMSEELDLERPGGPAPAGTEAEAWHYSSFDLWYGWKYDLGNAGMFKIGDSWEWDGVRYDLLAGDMNLFHIGSKIVVSSHPDADGKLAGYALRREYPGVTNPPPSLSYNYSDWRRSGNLDRGLIDQSYVHSDGSVSRHSAVDMLEDDGRRTAVPWADYAGYQLTGWQLFVPNR